VRLNYEDSVRSGWLYETAAAAATSLGERWDIEGRARVRHRSADHAETADADRSGAAFDLTQQSLEFEARCALSSTATVVAGYARQFGDVVSTSSGNAGLDAIATAETPDRVFGPNASAYRVRAVTHVFSVGLSQAVGRLASLNYEIRRQLSYAAADNTYHKSIALVSYLHRF
jgi:hypothetical protein